MSASRATRGRSGRRPGTTQTRDEIARAAQSLFAEVGYDRTTIRGIAAAAGVDPALVVHFYGPKDALFREVMQLPPQVMEMVATLTEAPRGEVGRRFAQAIVQSLEHPQSRAIALGRIRSAASHPDAAAFVRETVSRDLTALARSLNDDRPETRGVLLGSQVVGMALSRYVVLVEPLASMDSSEVVDLLAPIFQRILVEPLD